MALSVLSVSQLNFYVKSLIESDDRLGSVMVKGEISNLNKHYSGHYYFSLKDGQSVIKCVMFRSAAAHLRFNAENGMMVIVSGRISVYERDGQYQLYANDMQPDGIGSLQLAFEQLKEKLYKLGLFAPEHKKPLPKFPKRVGVITSPTGAAVRDIMNVLGRRYPLCKIVLCPVLVQGAGSEEQLIKAVRLMNEKNAADVIIMGRGGGSIEDLWSFNSKKLAYEIYNSKIPIISAVGHEIDFTISDFVADLRAPTPSAAAELAVPDAMEIAMRIDSMMLSLKRSYIAGVEKKRQQLKLLKNSRALTSKDNIVNIKRERLDRTVDMLVQTMRNGVQQKANRFGAAAVKLDALSPLKVIGRGYCIARGDKGIIKSTQDVGSGDKIKLTVADGSISCVAE